MTPPIPALEAAAFQFLLQHEGEHFWRDRALLVEPCIAHLVDACGAPRQRAADVAMQALGELDSRHHRIYIDCTRTTSFTLFMVDQDRGTTRAIALSDLLPLLDALYPAPAS